MGRIGAVLASVGSLSLRLPLNPNTVLLNSKRVRSENSVTPWIARWVEPLVLARSLQIPLENLEPERVLLFIRTLFRFL